MAPRSLAYRNASLYEDAYAFTMLRLYSHIFAVWIAVVFLLLAADLLGLVPRRRWFVGAVGTTVVTMLLALNLINPEGMVVMLNVDHAQSTHKIDASYFAELSSDATLALLASRAGLDPALREQVSSVACAGPRQYSGGLPAFNWADAQAANARRVDC